MKHWIQLIWVYALCATSFAADVTIDGTIATATARYYRNTVFTSASTGYVFYTGGADQGVYSKTTDGGTTWSGENVVFASTVVAAGDVWYDQWTPGNTTGTIIHTAWLDTLGDDVVYRAIDTASDTVTVSTVVFAGASAVGSNGTSVGITVARSGYIYVCYNIDGGTEFGFKRSTDAGATWSADLGGSFNEGSTDHFWLYPATGTGDNNDIWAVYHDSSATAATMKMWDSSAAAQVESSTVHAIVAPGTDITVYQYPSSGSVRLSDGHLFCVGWTERDSATGDLVTFDVDAVNSGSLTGITSKTNINTDKDDTYQPAVFINQINNNIYVAYNGKRDGSETLGTTTKVYYTLSTDGGTSWSAGDTAYMEGAAAIVTNVWTPLMGLRFYADWRQGASTIIGNAVNSIGFTASSIKTVMDLPRASVKTVDDLAIASVKTVMDLP